MLDDLAGKRTGERIQILRERKGLSRPVLAGLVGMSASWLKGIERGTRLPPRLPLLVKLAEALAVGDVAVLAGIDMDLGWATSVPVASFARIPHDAVPAIRAPQGHARSSPGSSESGLRGHPPEPPAAAAGPRCQGHRGTGRDRRSSRTRRRILRRRPCVS
jgi:transcriptional regulator with XRE-family HTH domain